LIKQRRSSPFTVAAYRDTFRLLLAFVYQHSRKPPSELGMDDLGAPLIGAFLEHLEQGRGNTVRTRNARLAALYSFFRFASFRHPEHAALIQRVLAIPLKRYDRALVTFLTRPEIDALVAATDRSNGWDDATTRSCWSLCRLACASPNWPSSVARMCIWTPART
jgi:site-specific recombinase XerD